MLKFTFSERWLWFNGLFFNSCATICTGTSVMISFNSDPSDAIVLINGVEQNTTICELKVKRKSGDADLEIELDGYETRLISLCK